MSLRIKQSEDYRGNDWWVWAVWLDGRPDELAAVKEVVYTLHPTFNPPVHTIRTRRNGFRMDGQGWGRFTMHLEIRFRDNTIKRRKYDLKLYYPEESSATQSKKKEAASGVFMSSTATDADTAETIRRALMGHGIEVVSAAEIGSGVPLSSALESGLAKASHALFVMSGRPSLWMNREMDAAREHKVPITVILVGENPSAPEFSEDTQQLRIKGPADLEKVVEAFSSLVHGRDLTVQGTASG